MSNFLSISYVQPYMLSLQVFFFRGRVFPLRVCAHCRPLDAADSHGTGPDVACIGYDTPRPIISLTSGWFAFINITARPEVTTMSTGRCKNSRKRRTLGADFIDRKLLILVVLTHVEFDLLDIFFS